MVETGNSSPSGDQIINSTATTAALGDVRREDEIKLSPPDSEEFGRPSGDLSTERILPITSPSVSQSNDPVVDVPNVASMSIEPRPADNHETTLQEGGEQTELAHPLSILRTSAPSPGSMPASNSDALPIHTSISPKFCVPTRTNTEFIDSFPQIGTSNMIFSNGTNAAHRRRSMANTSALTEYEADLTSKDRLKQKEAVRNILASKIRTDWSFPDKVDQTALEPSDTLPEGDPAQPTEWIERGDWLSELSSSDDSDNGLEQMSSNSTTGNEKTSKTKVAKKLKLNPFRFDSPEDIGETLRRSADRRKLRRQRKLHEELEYNEGLRCFTARRNAWTNARVVKRPRDSGSLPNSPSTGEKPPAHPEANEDDEPILDTLLPIAPPLLPPDTPMRRNITSRAHSTIYDKVVMQSQTPLCPINLQTVVTSCVEGWKRDGEWPPKGTEPEAALTRRRNAAAAGAAQKGVWRRSLQKVFGRAGTEIV